MRLALRVALVTFVALLLAMVASVLTATRVQTNGVPISVSLAYIESDAPSASIDEAPAAGGMGTVAAGVLEGSNVDLAAGVELAGDRLARVPAQPRGVSLGRRDAGRRQPAGVAGES